MAETFLPDVEIEAGEPPIKEAQETDRKTAAFQIIMGGRDWAGQGLIQLVRNIRIEENDDGADLAVIEVINAKLAFTNDIMFQEGNAFEVLTGYAGDGSDFVSRGRFFMTEPEFSYTPDGLASIVVRGLGESVLLAKDQKRRSFMNMSDSQIAEKMAREYRLKADVQRTAHVFTQVVQAGQTDMQFLRSRARLYGYQVFVRDGILHFHQVRNIRSGVTLRYRSGGSPNVSSVRASIKVFHHGYKMKASRFDPLTGQILKSESRGVRDAVAQGDERGLKANETRKVEAMTGQPVRFLSGDGHLQDKAELDRMVETYSQATRHVVNLEVTSRGYEKVLARQTVLLTGLDKLSGTYYVKQVQHLISDQYVMRLQLRRSLTGTFDISPAIADLSTSSSGTRETQSGGPDDVSSETVGLGVGGLSEIYSDGSGGFERGKP